MPKCLKYGKRFKELGTLVQMLALEEGSILDVYAVEGS